MMTEEKKHLDFSSQNIHFKTEEAPGCRVFVTATCGKESIQKAYQQALKEISKEVSIPGFRKGKAPAAILEKNYSQYIKQEQIETLVNLTGDVLVKHLERAAVPNTFKGLKGNFKEDGDYEVSFSLELYPKIPKIDLEQIVLPTVPVEAVTPFMVEEAVQDRLYYLAEKTSITDREIQQDDFVILNIYDLNNNGKPLAEDARFHYTENLGEWLRKALAGHKVNDIIEADSYLDPNAADTIKQIFQPTRCKVEIKEIVAANFPELNEETLKKLGVNSREELYQQATASLEKNHQATQRAVLKEELSKKVYELYPTDFPESNVETVYKYQKDNQNLSSEEKAAKLAEIKKQLALEFILENFALEKNLTPDIKKVEERFNSQLHLTKLLAPQLYQELTQPQLRNMFQKFYAEEMLELAVDYLLKNVRFM